MNGKRTYGGRYEVIEPVGSGGMAEVYRARDELLGREVAIKVLSERFSRDPSFVERFRREAQRAANLSHPNIVGLYDYGSDGDTYFIVMEYIEGRTLAEVIAANGALMPERAAEIAADVGAALQRAHGANIVHRDIKPGNIMLTSSGQTKVTDFGIARAVGGDHDATMTQTGMVIGTAAYLSPEQAQGEPVDARSDIYALGCVLYESLTGSTPFTGDTPLSIAYKHVREEPTPPSRLNRDVPSDLDAIVMKAMAKEPGARYNSADEMRADIDRFLNGQRVLAAGRTAAQTSVMAGSGTQVMRQTEVMYDDETEERSPWFYIWITLAILLVAGIAAFFLANSLLGGETVEVPGVVGLSESEARDVLDEAGLEWEIERRASGKPEGEVLEQDPEEGETAEEGDTVRLVVSAGPRQTEVPDLEGMTVEAAEAELKQAKLKLGEIIEEENDDFEPGEIFDQEPLPGEEVDRNSEVDVYVSSGGAIVTVPFVTTQSEEDAVAEIEAVGLIAEVVREPSDDPEGTVIAQDPAGGSEAQEGDTVRITVSEGQEAQPMPDVTGEDADEAEAFLEDEYGLEVSQAGPEGACAEPPGRVCSQDPDPGTEVSPGDSATLYVQGGGGALDFPGLLLAFFSFLV